MKKGLLSLLALALTVVGCQNYDDQFEELTSLIEDLQSDVDGLSGVSASITALQSTVAGITSAVQANGSAIASGNSAAATANAATAASLATVSSTLADLAASLNGVATAADLNSISSTLADVQADVRELLEANAVINQNITINNAATLEYVETLVATGADDPNVIVNGKVTIDTGALNADEKTRTNAVAAKLATILGDGAGDPGLTVDSDAAVTFTNLAFVDDDVQFDGSAQGIGALRTITGGLTTDYAGAQDYSMLTSVATFTITNNVSATSVNLDGVDVDAVVAGGAAGVLTLNNAGSINLGTAPFTQLTANAADSITTNADGTVASLSITATKGGTIDANSLDTVTGALTVTGASTTVLHMDDLDTAGATQITAQEAHLGQLDNIAAATTITATTIDISTVGSITAATDFNTANVLAGGLSNILAALTHEVGVINYPSAVVTGTGEIISAVATNVTVASIQAAGDLGGAETHLTLTAQGGSLAAVGATVTNLSVTAKADTDVDMTTGTAALVTVALSGTRSNTITGAAITNVTLTDTSSNVITAAAAALATATLAGTIVSFKSAATGLAELNNTANYLDIPGTVVGETPITFELINTTAITSIDLSTMNRVANVVITGNSALTEVIAPSSDDLLTPGANPSITIKTNSIQATYTAGVAAYAGDGINPATPYQAPCIYAPGLSTWPAYITAISAANSPVTVDIDFDSSNAGNDDHADEVGADANSLPGAAGSISTAAELALISGTACGS